MALTALAVVGAGLGAAATSSADPSPTYPVPAPPLPAPPSEMTPNQPAVPAGDPAAAPAGDPAAPPPPPPGPPGVPEIPNPQYGSGKYGGGVFGTLMDLWDQARNPNFTQDQIMGVDGMTPGPPPGAGPAPKLPPGYVSTNSPGSETPSTGPAGGPATGRPELPPGYYRLDGPPPPGYFDTPAVIPTTAVPVPANPGA